MGAVSWTTATSDNEDRVHHITWQYYNIYITGARGEKMFATVGLSTEQPSRAAAAGPRLGERCCLGDGRRGECRGFGGWLGGVFPQNRVQHLHEQVGIRFGKNQRRTQLDYIVAGAIGARQDAAFA